MAYKSNRNLEKKRVKELKRLLEQINVDPDCYNSGPTNNFKYLDILDEALTHTSAQKEVNHERLEFLGDAVLRLAASEFIDRNFPTMHVGERSALRAQLVSDRWLTKVGRIININQAVIIGPKAAGDSSAQATIEAEATEALIGAIYEFTRSIDPIINWLTPHWEKESSAVLADPHKLNPKSALQEWSQSKGLDLPKYYSEERSQKHGDQKRFFCKVDLGGKTIGEGWGGSRQQAEKKAARTALHKISKFKII